MANVFDNFNRANETPLAAPWATGSGDAAFNLSGNIAVPASLAADSCSVYNGAGAPTWANDQGASVKVTVTGTTSSTGGGVCLRHASGSRTQYRIVVNKAGSNNVEIARFAPTYTQIAVRTTTWSNGDLLAAEVTGPSSAAVIKVFKNGVQLGADINDNSTLTSGAPGISYSGSIAAMSL